MKYILIPKDDLDKEEEITKEEAIKLLRNSYQEPEYALENAERLFNNRISMQFNNLEIRL